MTDEWTRFQFELSSLEKDRFDVTGVFTGRSEEGPFTVFVDDVHFE